MSLDIFAFFGDLQYQFYFVVDVLGKVGMVECRVVFEQGRIRLEEDHRGGWALVFQFLDMLRIVAANGDDFHNWLEKFQRQRKGFLANRRGRRSRFLISGCINPLLFGPCGR